MEAARLIKRFSQLAVAESDTFTVRRAARLISFYLGARIEVGDASQYLFHYARNQGYKIPPYPFAGTGEIKEFFADWDARDLPGCYERLGVGSADYPHLPERTIVVVMDARFRRRAFFLEGVLYKQDKGFCGLAESGVCERLSDAALAALLNDILLFLEGKDLRGPVF